ncbi:tetratricopeptide repeat protein [Aetokthonos hydrillicola Thurmond2011]|jgi:tetratricopeptide (TPR) repeat protein|uniref:Tetratricopeptide repeat protein n=1 Tax=Aetokthonos hydrillicola Thurmond2011 TaxID=2712845 RepID=A0AAP5I5S3_9CYAN|nr:ATP-binding protein [Aetokthonos hydrillicola]MBO3460154.1 tetratricopeptide repeat protein [Aetokthonos hydrillicola CCALA 1050]MBW4590481.1 tetratricopeptide repeat protein [Aetokthonos hydrillicola CCALA 1050]MDR9893010.1 tetratricopeptide repeat protein [Aetokthonos hydrillicola Thurmond2011]
MSLQDILKRRQQTEFVGREEQLHIFRYNLGLPPKDYRRRFFFNIYGQGGVGKTALMQQIRKLADEAKALTAYTNEDEPDVPTVIGHIAEQLEQQGHVLKEFKERYRTYRQCRQQLETDPEAPQGFAALVGQTVGKIGMSALKQSPAGLITSFVNEDMVTKQMGEWTAFVAKKLTNKDDVHLVQQPIAVLTPLFLKELCKLPESNPIALFFDTYEVTKAYLDDWLRDLLEGRYGSMPENIVVAIAGRYALERNYWAPYESLIIRLPLEPFTEAEARDFLSRKGVKNAQVIEAILRLSGQLPLLLATLAAGTPDDPTAVTDPTDTAVERFLLWVEEPQRRQLALDAALPRYLNQDVLAAMVGSDQAESLFDWLKQMPFVTKKREHWTYHSVVRDLMLRYKRQQSAQSWAALHEKLENYYQTLCNNLGLDAASIQQDTSWQEYQLEVVYHNLCQSPQKSLPITLNQFLSAFKHQRLTVQRWAETIFQAGEDTGVADVKLWGQQLIEGIKAYDEEHYEAALSMFTALLQSGKLEAEWQSSAYDWRGNLYRRAGQYSQALADINEAIQLTPEEAKYFTDRGVVYLLMQCYQEALADLNHAISLEPEHEEAIASRGVTYLLQERYEEALADFNQALEIKPEYQAAFVSRGVVYRQMERYQDALTDLNQGLGLNPNALWAVIQRGKTYQEMERYEEALADFNQVLAIKPNNFGAIANRGVIYRQLGYHEEALADLNQAITQNPDDQEILANRGETYRQIGRYQEALADLNRTIELQPDDGWALASRATTYRQLGRYEEALVDFEKAITLEPKNDWWLYGRALVYRLLGELQEMRADLMGAIQLALGKYEQEPPNWRKRLNLALYYLVLGESEHAEQIYQAALGVAVSAQIREAIRDLDDFLILEPNSTQGNSMRELLRCVD